MRPDRATVLAAEIVRRSQSADPEFSLGTEIADSIRAAQEEAEKWQAACGPLLDFLSGSPSLCQNPVEYARELYERAERAEAALARAVEEAAEKALRLVDFAQWLAGQACERPVVGCNCESCPPCRARTALVVRSGDGLQEERESANERAKHWQGRATELARLFLHAHEQENTADYDKALAIARAIASSPLTDGEADE